MKKWSKRILLFLLILFAWVGFQKTFKELFPQKNAVGVVEIAGTLWVSDDWVQEIESFRKDPNIRAVIARIQSPGGTVAASQEIYAALKKLSEKKPVVASLGTIAASGGLYAALAANKIVADAGTLTGSIGVRMEHFNIGELLRFAKIDYDTIKSGHFKDMASFSRPMTAEERGLLEGMMQEIHGQFKEAVATSRNLKPKQVEQFADGRIFSGAFAKEIGVIDEIGDFGKAVEIVSKLAKIEGEANLVYSREPSSWWVKNFLSHFKISLLGPQMCYLYP